MEEGTGIFTKFTEWYEVKFCNNRLFVMDIPRKVKKGNAIYMTNVVFTFSMN